MATPLSDAVFTGIEPDNRDGRIMAALNLARRLETERDAAQEQIAKLTTDLMGQRGDYDELVKRYFIIESEGTLLINERNKALSERDALAADLQWIAGRYDSHKTTAECAADAYDMSCVARAALAAMDKS